MNLLFDSKRQNNLPSHLNPMKFGLHPLMHRPEVGSHSSEIHPLQSFMQSTP